MDETQLRQTARHAIESGRLPLARPDRMWGGPGNGATCAVCAGSVGSDEMSFELEFANRPASAAANYHFHVRCFAAWEFERDDPLRPANGNGTIGDREHDSTSTRGPCE